MFMVVNFVDLKQIALMITLILEVCGKKSFVDRPPAPRNPRKLFAHKIFFPFGSQCHSNRRIKSSTHKAIE